MVDYYTQQALSHYKLPRLKRIAADLGLTPTGNKTQRQTWIYAIIAHQSTQLQKIARTFTDEQDIAQYEFDGYITDQATASAPEELTVREINFFDHEIFYAAGLIAIITYDNDLTQPWMVMVNGKEKFRANTWARCHRFIEWHYKDGTLNEELLTLPTQATQPTLPPTEQLEPEEPCTTGNEIMVQLFDACEQHGLELLDDGIYQNDVKLGQAGCTNGNWWFASATQAHQEKVFCDSAEDAVWLLQMPEEAGVLGAGSKGEILSPPHPAPCSISSYLPTANEYLQYHPFEQLASGELQGLFDAAALVAV